VPEHRARTWSEAGLWDDLTLGDRIAARVTAYPNLPVSVHSEVRPFHGTYSEIAWEARRLAGGLAARGVRPGDVIASQLPNWREAITTIWAAGFLGAVVVPIVHFYGRREVDYILDRTGVRVLVTARRFGRLDFHLDPADRPAVKKLDLLVVVDAGKDLPVGALPYEDVLAEPMMRRADVDPDGPALVAYTSGTTAAPKGVVHSHRTLGAELHQVTAIVSPDQPRLTAAPVGHVGGMMSGVLIPLVQHGPINLIDVWDTEKVLELMIAEGLACGGGSTFFLTSLLDHPGLTPHHLELMRHITMGGSPVPEATARRAEALGIALTRNYGSTEHPTITGSLHTDAADKRLATDGRPLPGVEIRLVDDDGQDVGPGEPGEILSRGPECFIGYTDPALTMQYLDADGWYRTEDIGMLDADGYLTITDRKKDVIIRGGENISAAEVEQVLARMPNVAEVAVVGAPNDRFGERVCAFVRLREQRDVLGLGEVREAMARAGLGRQKWPEDLRLVSDFPRTAFGKIRKRELRDQLRRTRSMRGDGV
jgi:acyl-CoA synthetase (AMP-forming)/AMP-acid ligase II